MGCSPSVEEVGAVVGGLGEHKGQGVWEAEAAGGNTGVCMVQRLVHAGRRGFKAWLPGCWLVEVAALLSVLCVVIRKESECDGVLSMGLAPGGTQDMGLCLL